MKDPHSGWPGFVQLDLFREQRFYIERAVSGVVYEKELVVLPSGEDSIKGTRPDQGYKVRVEPVSI